MAVIAQQRRKQDVYFVPAGGEILWYGIAADIPSSYVLDSYMANVFVRGALVGAASNTPVGSDSHAHTNPASTGTAANHTHPIGSPSVGNASGSKTTYGAPNDYYANQNHSHNGSTSTSGSAGSHSHTLASTAGAPHLPPYKRLYLIRATIDAEFPIGGILMWNGTIATRPLKTNICNGLLGTLDLRTYFVHGASIDADIGDSGGSLTHVHANANTGSSGSHSHTTNIPIGGPTTKTNQASGYAGTTVSDGSHDHTMNPATDTDADHTHTVGATDSASNLPPFVKLYFVMRTE